MTNPEFDGLFDNEWDDRGELAWTEGDWEQYLADQEKVIREYARTYERVAPGPDRIDKVARELGWESASESEAADDDGDPDDAPGEDWEPYTIHRNPVYVATKALYLGLIANWQRLASEPGRISSAAAMAMHASLHRGQEVALHGIHALEMGDYTLAVCFFKRALRELNTSMALLGEPAANEPPVAARYRRYARPRMFDLREIWLRVMGECRIDDEPDED